VTNFRLWKSHREGYLYSGRENGGVQRNDNRAGERRGRRVRVFRKLTAVNPKVEELRTRLLQHYTHKHCEEHVNLFYFEKHAFCGH
jgi:hypothetical protein